MEKFVYKTRVRYAEIDQMGIAYYGSYFLYMESARTGLLRERGYPYDQLEKKGYFLPVSETKCKYIKGAVFDEEIKTETTIGFIHNASIKFIYNIYNENSELLAKGHTIHPVVNNEWKIIAVPDILRNALEPYLI